MRTCTCGNVEDEHGGDPEFPGSTACNVEGCDCVAFEDVGRETRAASQPTGAVTP